MMENTNDKTAVKVPTIRSESAFNELLLTLATSIKHGRPCVRDTERLIEFIDKRDAARAEEARREAVALRIALDESRQELAREKARRIIAAQRTAGGDAVAFTEAWKRHYQYSPSFKFLNDKGKFCTPADDPVHFGWIGWQLAQRPPAASAAVPGADARTWASDGGLRCLNCGKGLSAHEYQRNCPPVAEAAAQAELDAQLRREVSTMYQMLDEGEWAEHVATTPHGQCLETAISRLVSRAAAAQADDGLLKRLRALAEKWNADAVAVGFAGSEPSYELLDILDAAPTAQPTPSTEYVTRESALEALEHVEQHNGPGRKAEAVAMLEAAQPTPKENAPDLEGRGVELQAPVGTSAKIEASVTQPTPPDDELRRAAKILLERADRGFRHLAAEFEILRAALRQPGALPDDELSKLQRYGYDAFGAEFGPESDGPYVKLDDVRAALAAKQAGKAGAA